MLVEKIPVLLDHIKNNQKIIAHNAQLFDIMEGDLMSHLVSQIIKYAQTKSTQISVDRACPINILKKVISKLSKSYKSAPKRTTENPSDLEIIRSYEENGVDAHFNDANENFNTYKNSTIELFENPNVMAIQQRAIPSMQFLPYSDDEINPLNTTVMTKFMGQFKDERGNKRQKYWAYSDAEFVSFDDNGSLVPQDMFMNQGINPFDTIPFPYLTRSRYLLVPKSDTDVLQVVTLVALLLTDLNFASKFLSNPILYGVDVAQENFELSPNIFWNLKSDSEGRAPSIGVIKAEPNIEGQINLIKNQLGMWLESRNIRPGVIGRLDAENFASGISLMIGDMDTSEDIKIQQTYFKQYEVDFWKRLAKMHNVLAMSGRLADRRLFSNPETLVIDVEFESAKPFEGRKEKVERLRLEVDANFMSRKRAIVELNPGMNEDEIENLMKEIEEEKGQNFVEVREENGMAES